RADQNDVEIGPAHSCRVFLLKDAQSLCLFVGQTCPTKLMEISLLQSCQTLPAGRVKEFFGPVPAVRSKMTEIDAFAGEFGVQFIEQIRQGQPARPIIVGGTLEEQAGQNGWFRFDQSGGPSPLASRCVGQWATRRVQTLRQTSDGEYVRRFKH